MSPRPRKVSDDDIFTATYHAMNRLGPGELTLAEIAHDAGVTAGALAQRFGSKRALLLALSERAAASAGDFIQELARSHRSPLAAIRAYATCMAAMAQSPSALARSLAYLQIDIADPEFRVHLATQSRATHEGLVELFESAIEKREVIRGANPSKLAHMIEALVSGSLLTWAAFDETRAVERTILENVDTALSPYLSRRRRAR